MSGPCPAPAPLRDTPDPGTSRLIVVHEGLPRRPVGLAIVSIAARTWNLDPGKTRPNKPPGRS